MSFSAASQEYGAIHFHDDAVDDARWEVDFALTVPEDMKSGVYAARLRLGGRDAPGSEDYIPFIVRPPAGRPTAKIAVIIPTASYMAYANENLSADSQVAPTPDRSRAADAARRSLAPGKGWLRLRHLHRS